MQNFDKFKKLQDADPWMVGEDIPDIDFQFSQIWLSSFVNDLEKTVGVNYGKVLCAYRGYDLVFYFGEKDSNNFAIHVLEKILKNPAFGRKMNTQIRKYSAQLKKFSEKITPEYLAFLSNKEFAELYVRLDELHTELYTWGWLPNAVDVFHGNFTTYMKERLAEKLPEDDINTALIGLNFYPEKSMIDQEQTSLLKLADLKKKKSKLFEKQLEAHRAKYFYLKHQWLGKEGVYTRDYYLEEINKFIKTKQDPAKVLKEKDRMFKAAVARRKKFIKDLKLDDKLVAIFDVYAEFAVTKVFRRDAQLYWAYKMDFIFEELKKRLGISFMEARFLFPWDVADALKKGKLLLSFKKELKERTKFCVFYGEKGVDILLYGKDATRAEAMAKQQKSVDVKVLHGQVACLGKVTGFARIVNSIADMKKLKKGEILVSIATNPDIVPAMKIAGAIVTEQGGVTSHAAIVSRELGVPCVIGTKIATKVFKDGDLLEVDAQKGIITLLKR